MKWEKTSEYSICTPDRLFHISRSGPEPFKYTLWKTPGSQRLGIYSCADSAKAAAKKHGNRILASGAPDGGINPTGADRLQTSSRMTDVQPEGGVSALDQQ